MRQSIVTAGAPLLVTDRGTHRFYYYSTIADAERRIFYGKNLGYFVRGNSPFSFTVIRVNKYLQISLWYRFPEESEIVFPFLCSLDKFSLDKTTTFDQYFMPFDKAA